MKKKKIAKKKNLNFQKSYVGVIDIKPSGISFVNVEQLENDIVIYSNHINNALPNDLVKVDIIPDKRKGDRLVGKVHAILKRRTEYIIGKIDKKSGRTTFIPHNKHIENYKFIIKDLDKVSKSCYCLCKIVDSNKSKKRISLVIKKKLKNTNHTKLIIDDCLISHDFNISYPKHLNETATKIPKKISKVEIRKRQDFRKITTFTIDPEDAKDFDDALSVNKLDNNNISIGIHIADVSHFVRHDTEIDKEAYQRGTSVYIPQQVFPMLPEMLSNDLCSLKPNVDRMTFSLMIEFDKDFSIIKYSFYKGLIHSDHRFTYSDAQSILDGKQRHKYTNELKTLHHIATHLRKKRFENGAIHFSSNEIQFLFDDKGEPYDTEIKVSQVAHHLVEEFMILANKLVATYISKTKMKKSILYRVHDKPNDTKLKAFKHFIQAKGYILDTSSLKAIAKSFNQILSKSKNTIEEFLIQRLGIRTMAKAMYSNDNIGHYGLGLSHYAHFTSPIRRYPDIIVHRVLENVINKKTYSTENIEEMGLHCSQKEIDATEVERKMNRLYQVKLMSKMIGKTFEGIISGVSHLGFWVEIKPYHCEGFVSINQLLELGDYAYSPTTFEIFSVKNKKDNYTFGDNVSVVVERTDIDKMHVDLLLVR